MKKKFTFISMSTDAEWESIDFDTVIVDMNKEDEDAIKLARKFAMNNAIVSLKVKCTSDVEYMEDGEEAHPEWPHDGFEYLIVKDSVFLYAENSYNPSSNIELMLEDDLD